MFKKIAPDKWKHFYVGIMMGLFLQAAGTRLLHLSFRVSIISSFLVIVAISYGFELYSKFTGRGHYEIADAIASIIGGILGMAIIITIGFFL